LHDGAVIIQGDQIRAAACFLPLSMNPALARKLGTRHRAAIGITEEADCIALVASEETGRMSVAAAGDIEVDVTLARVEERLSLHFGRKRQRVRALAVPVGGPPPGAPAANSRAGKAS
jgi:diadenylate cyclase